MPVTARFSRHFYDRLGDQAVGELVEWFNQVDATGRADLREISELNYRRFEVRLDQRVDKFDRFVMHDVVQDVGVFFQFAPVVEMTLEAGQMPEGAGQKIFHARRFTDLAYFIEVGSGEVRAPEGER